MEHGVTSSSPASIPCPVTPYSAPFVCRARFSCSQDQQGAPMERGTWGGGSSNKAVLGHSHKQPARPPAMPESWRPLSPNSEHHFGQPAWDQVGKEILRRVLALPQRWRVCGEARRVPGQYQAHWVLTCWVITPETQAPHTGDGGHSGDASTWQSP